MITHKNRNIGLARVLNATQSRWTNGTVTVEHHAGTWTWLTPEGAGTSNAWEDALVAVSAHLA